MSTSSRVTWTRRAIRLFVIDQDYLEAPQTKEAGGVYYPDWGQGDFKLEFEWEPLAYAINDGQTRAQAALMPESYGQNYEDTRLYGRRPLHVPGRRAALCSGLFP